jgi:MinD-like ATPase involved in chromosome partitioning or flagellar assembly
LLAGMAAVIGVLGGSGGVGASTFAAVLAAVAGEAVLVDLDVLGGGLDVLLGVEAVPGARWSGLRLAGGRLDPAELRAGLPRWGPVSLLAADVAELDPDAVLEVLGAAAEAGSVLLDLPRAACAERAAALLRCDLVVVLARADVGGLVAAHAAVAALPELPVGLLLRRGEVPARDAAELVGAPLLGVLPALGGRFALDPWRVPRRSSRVAAGVLSGVRAPTIVSRQAPVAGRHAVLVHR